jgi:hypothetical protein
MAAAIGSGQGNQPESGYALKIVRGAGVEPTQQVSRDHGVL